MENLQPNQFEDLSSQEKSLVMFYADWCPFCRKFKPIFESSANSATNSKLKFYESSMDDDDNPLWERFSIEAVPTIIAFEKGKIVSRRDAKKGIGLNKADLDSIIKETDRVP